MRGSSFIQHTAHISGYGGHIRAHGVINACRAALSAFLYAGVNNGRIIAGKVEKHPDIH
jgi:hypothetical protein